MHSKIRIGDALVEQGVLTADQLQKALAHQHTEGGRLGAILVKLGFVTEEFLLKKLANLLSIDYVDLKHFVLKPDLVRQLPETHARRYRAIILKEQGDELTVGMVDPQDIFAFGEIARLLKRPIRQAIIEEGPLLSAIDMLYRNTDAISTFADELSAQLGDREFAVNTFGEGLGENDAPVVKLLQSIFKDAVQVRASDIHIEPDEDVLRIRLRVDGVLQEQVMKNKNIIAALTQRLKLMAGLDIAEKRLPQDGRFDIQLSNKRMDVRLSTMPVTFGEAVVMRLLDQSVAAKDLKDLGMPEEIMIPFRKLIHRSQGMILVTGPTGSGKTTTLYSALHELNKPEVKIITVEDPVEYRLERVTQVQVNSKISLDFARVLRSALRQDPDVMLVGEIRDAETAQIALRAAMTGHLVLATLHTNDARSSAMRLIDVGAEGYLVAVALRAVVAQRLVRRICKNCTIPYQISAREKNWLEAVVGEQALEYSFKVGNGCTHCNLTGYSGRVGVFELLQINEAMMDALRRNDTSDFNRVVLAQKNMKTLGMGALDLAVEGKTTLSEVMRIAEELEDQDM